MIDEATKQILDAGAVATFVAAIIGALPSIATAFTIVWLGLRIYESETVQRLLGRRPPDWKGGGKDG